MSFKCFDCFIFFVFCFKVSNGRDFIASKATSFGALPQLSLFRNLKTEQQQQSDSIGNSNMQQQQGQLNMLGNEKENSVGFIWCDPLKTSEDYMPLLGSRLLVRTPIGDFIVRWNLPDGTIRTQAIQFCFVLFCFVLKK